MKTRSSPARPVCFIPAGGLPAESQGTERRQCLLVGPTSPSQCGLLDLYDAEPARANSRANRFVQSSVLQSSPRDRMSKPSLAPKRAGNGFSSPPKIPSKKTYASRSSQSPRKIKRTTLFLHHPLSQKVISMALKGGTARLHWWEILHGLSLCPAQSHALEVPGMC